MDNAEREPSVFVDAVYKSNLLPMKVFAREMLQSHVFGFWFGFVLLPSFLLAFKMCPLPKDRHKGYIQKVNKIKRTALIS